MEKKTGEIIFSWWEMQNFPPDDCDSWLSWPTSHVNENAGWAGPSRKLGLVSAPSLEVPGPLQVSEAPLIYQTAPLEVTMPIPQSLERTLCMHPKSFQSCPILCHPIVCSPPFSSVHGMGCHFLLHFLLPDPGIKPASLTSPALAGRFFTTSVTWEAQKSTGHSDPAPLGDLLWFIMEPLRPSAIK